MKTRIDSGNSKLLKWSMLSALHGLLLIITKYNSFKKNVHWSIKIRYHKYVSISIGSIYLLVSLSKYFLTSKPSLNLQSHLFAHVMQMFFSNFDRFRCLLILLKQYQGPIIFYSVSNELSHLICMIFSSFISKLSSPSLISTSELLKLIYT